MKYRVTTYKSFSGDRKIVELPDSTYGEWIIYEDNVPTYHIDCFREDSESDALIQNYLSIKDKNHSIERLLKQLRNTTGNKLSFRSIPFFSKKVSSEIQELDLKPIPLSWLENIEQ